MDGLTTMIRLIEELSKMRTPIIFKGALVLKTALSNIPLDTNRMTMDIDGDWVNEPPTMAELTQVINMALHNVDKSLNAVAYREYGNGKSAGFNIENSSKKKIFSVDISVKQNPFYCTYTTGINQIAFLGASPEKMFADKMRAVSTRLIFRRLKDLYDLYLLSSLPGYKTRNVMDILQHYKPLGDFEDFRTKIDELRHAYEVMKRIENKPDYNIVYERVYFFLQPFISGCGNQNLVWTGTQWNLI